MHNPCIKHTTCDISKCSGQSVFLGDARLDNNIYFIIDDVVCVMTVQSGRLVYTKMQTVYSSETYQTTRCHNPTRLQYKYSLL
jgi:hypothetical protein